MEDVLVGILALLVGALFCFRGFMTMRVVIPVVGAFSGFMFGVGLTHSITDEGFLGSATAWIVGAACALVFGLLAYLYYEVSVIVAMAAVGFAFGTSVVVAVGVNWSWLVILVGVVTGAFLALAAIVADLPTILLIVLTSFAGSSIVLFGLMLMFGTLDSPDLENRATTQELADGWWWYVLYIALAVAGLVVQFRTANQLSESMREAWAREGGREFRRT